VPVAQVSRPVSSERRGRPATQVGRPVLQDVFRKPVRIAGALLALATLFLVQKAYSYQVLHDQDLLARDCKVYAEDKVKRPQHNPRLNSLARELTRGTIYDRNGIPLATSTWDELERHRPDYEKLG